MRAVHRLVAEMEDDHRGHASRRKLRQWIEALTGVLDEWEGRMTFWYEAPGY